MPSLCFPRARSASGVSTTAKAANASRADRTEGRQGVENAQCMVRDTFMASVTWYEWEEGVREHVDKLMARGLEK